MPEIIVPDALYDKRRGRASCGWVECPATTATPEADGWLWLSPAKRRQPKTWMMSLSR